MNSKKSDRNSWSKASPEYKRLTQDKDFDSEYLRNAGLIPNVVDLIGPCNEAVVLDAGCGPGWLFDKVNAAKGYSCDHTDSPNARNNSIFTVQDVSDLNYYDNMFDIVVAGIVMCWISDEDLQKACQEFFRITKSSGGRLIVSLVHPYFYRTGKVTENGEYLITQDLAKSFTKQIKIGGQVGPFRYHYRTYDMYVNTLIDAGWSIRRVRDWFIDMDEYNVDMCGRRRVIIRTGIVPMYTFFECEKYQPLSS